MDIVQVPQQVEVVQKHHQVLTNISKNLTMVISVVAADINQVLQLQEVVVEQILVITVI